MPSRASLPFDGSDGDAANEVFLNEWIHKNDGSRCHDSHRQFVGFTGHSDFRHAGLARDRRGELHAVEDAVQMVLQWVELVIVNEQHRLKPLIPVPKRDEQANGGKRRRAQRQDNAHENTKIARAIDAGPTP